MLSCGSGAAIGLGAGATLGIGAGATATGVRTALGAATPLRSLGFTLGGGGTATSATCTGLGTKSGGFLLNIECSGSRVLIGTVWAT